MDMAALLGEWWTVITSVIALASAVAAVTPTKIDNNAIDAVLRIINLAGLNIGQAKNADDK